MEEAIEILRLELEDCEMNIQIARSNLIKAGSNKYAIERYRTLRKSLMRRISELGKAIEVLKREKRIGV